MESKETFHYTYSAKQQEEIRAIREKYAAPTQEEDKMTQLRRLDAAVTQKATCISLVIGIIGALILGSGMSLVMTEIGSIIGLANAMIPGIAVGIVGMGMALSTYPIYKKLLNARKKKYAPEILKLSDKIMKG